MIKALSTVLFLLTWLFPQFSYAQISPRFFWIYHVVDRDSATGGYTSLVYDSLGLPHIAYRDRAFREDEGRLSIKYTRFNGTGWEGFEIERVGDGQTALALDGNDLPHIIHLDRFNRLLTYSRYDGQSWISETFDSWIRERGFLYDNAIQIDSQGKVHFAYSRDYTGAGSGVRVTHRVFDGSDFGEPAWIDSVSFVTGKWHTMILDDQERPVIAYYSFDFADLGFAIKENGKWRSEIIEENSFAQVQGYYASVRQAPDGDYCISFENWTRDKLRFARGQFGSWTIEDVTDLNIDGTLGPKESETPSSLALDAQGNPYIAFFDSTGGDLKLAYKLQDTWIVETIDSVGFTGKHASLQINGEGLPAVSYFDETNGFLKFAEATLTAPTDSDGDNVPDYLEVVSGGDPFDVDSDDDGLGDGEEDLNRNGLVEDYESDPTNADTDGDGIQDGTEMGVTSGLPGSSGILGTDLTKFIPDSDPNTVTDRLLFDTDSDGLGDGQEDRNFNGRVDADEPDPNESDSDGDGLIDGIDTRPGLSPIDVDSDDDGLADNDEDRNLDGVVDGGETDPTKWDTDDDGLADGVELAITEPVPDPDGAGRLLATNPQIFQPDADSTTTTDPQLADTDGDGLQDGKEDANRNGRFDAGETDPTDEDTDADGLQDGKEISGGTDPLDLDSDEDGLADGSEDANQNGKVDGGESSPDQFDSDADGLGDGLELGVVAGIQDPDGNGHLRGTDITRFIGDADPTTTTDPLNWDTDNDALADGEEDANGNGRQDGSETDPLNPDSDNDGTIDGDEVSFLSDPLDSSVTPDLSVLLQEDFSENNLNQWTVIDEGDIEGPSVWTVFDNSLVQSSNIYGGFDHTGIEDPNKPGTYIWQGATGWTNYKLSFNMRSDDDDALGVMFRFTGSDNYYRFSMNREKQFARLIRISNGQPTILAKQTFEYEVGRWYPAIIYAVDSRIQFYLDGRRIFDVNDNSLETGAFAFYSWRNAGSWFSDVLITGTDVPVSVEAQIDHFAFMANEHTRVIEWLVIGDFYESVELERKTNKGDFQRLIFQEHGDADFSWREPHSFIDREPWLAMGYQLTLRDANGTIIDSRELRANTEIIEDFSISTAYPNPFRQLSSFIVRTPEPSELHFKVYNILGQLIRTERSVLLNKGWHQFSWDGKNNNGNRVSAGAYFVHIELTWPNDTAKFFKAFDQKVIKIR